MCVLMTSIYCIYKALKIKVLHYSSVHMYTYMYIHTRTYRRTCNIYMTVHCIYMYMIVVLIYIYVHVYTLLCYAGVST